MSTTTLIRPDTDILDELDFEHTCCHRFPYFDSDECGAKASWVIIKPCCGAMSFICSPHLEIANPDGTRHCLKCRGQYVVAKIERHRL